ncbi:MAG: hypothetical protein ACRC0S_01975 [Fusobacteriaceae bacterium]
MLFYFFILDNLFFGKLQNLAEITNDNYNVSNKVYDTIIGPHTAKSIQLATNNPNNIGRTFLLRTTNHGAFSETISILTVGNGYLKKFDITTDENTTFVLNNLGTIGITNNHSGNIAVQISPLQYFVKDFGVEEIS